MTTERIKAAADLLEAHNAWRRGADGDDRMQNVKALGEAIDTAVECLRAAAPEVAPAEQTPSSHWHASGEPDPHDGGYYNRERAALPMGKLTDDELANGMFLNYDRVPSVQEMIAGKPTPIVWATAAKERIRWLSRALERALAAPPAQKVGAAREAVPAEPDDKVMRTLRAVVDHWNEFGPNDDFPRLMDMAYEVVIAHPAPRQEPAAPSFSEWYDANCNRTLTIRKLCELAYEQGRAAPQDVSKAPAAAYVLPPSGWTCTRTAGHSGPCAAVPSSDALAALRLAEVGLANMVSYEASNRPPGKVEHQSAWSALHAVRAALAAAPIRDAQDAASQGVQDAVTQALRKALNALPRFSFHLDARGNVRRVAERSGNWIEWQSAHELFDPVVVDHLLAKAAPSVQQALEGPKP